MLEIEVKEGAFRSKRLIQVLKGWVNGLSYEAIGRENHIAEETARDYGKELREEYHAKDKAEVIAKVVARGLISIKEVGGKGLLSVFLLTLSGFSPDSDDDFSRLAQTRVRVRTERRIDEA